MAFNIIFSAISAFNRENYRKKDHSLPILTKSEILYEIYFLKIFYIKVGKPDSVFQKSVRTSVDRVDLVKRRLKEETPCAEQKVE